MGEKLWFANINKVTRIITDYFNKYKKYFDLNIMAAPSKLCTNFSFLMKSIIKDRLHYVYMATIEIEIFISISQGYQ